MAQILGSVELKLYVYDGLVDKSLDDATELKYTITKDKISTHSKINLEIGELVRDYLTVSFNDNYLCNTRWVKAVVTFFDTTGAFFDVNNSQQTTTYLAFDGYGYFEDGANPALSTNVLISSTDHYLPENVAGKIPIFKEGVGKVIIDSSTTTITDDNNSNQKIQYITIPANANTMQVYATDNTTLLTTITFKQLCTPKHTAYKVTFVNKFGAFQDLYFFKKTTESFTVKDEKFNSNIIKTTDGTYDIFEGEQSRYNVSGKSRLSMNTDFISESMNQTIEELFISENVFIRIGSQTLPIIPVSKSLTFKTSLNDKLINYTVDFEFAFSKINNVR
jgi:hypothetical protein